MTITVRVRGSGRATREAGYTTGWRSLPWLTIQSLDVGSYRIDSAIGSEPLSSGSLWFIPAGCRHRHSVVGAVSVVTTWWQGEVQSHGMIDAFAGVGRPRVFPDALNRPLGRALRAALLHTDPGDLASALSSQARITALAAELARALGSALPVRAPTPATNSLVAVFSFIDANLHLPMERIELASRAGLAPSRFHQLFIAATGASPMAWVRRRRLEQAAELLASTTLGMVEIARRVGFCDQFHLNKRFRAAYGMPPTAFRRKAAG